MPRLQGHLAKQSTLPFLTDLVRFAVAFFECDRAYAAAAAGEYAPGSRASLYNPTAIPPVIGRATPVRYPAAGPQR